MTTNEPLVCTWCGKEIKKDANFAFGEDAVGEKHFFHLGCHNEMRKWYHMHEIR